jgi:inosine/xanthosine triphosphate pyrophosphatase family protein
LVKFSFLTFLESANPDKKKIRPGDIVFVTGNAGKLNEVREILAQDNSKAIDIISCDLDREPYSTCLRSSATRACANGIRYYTVPEIQGTTQEIANEKCRRAAEIVSFPRATSTHLNGFFQTP